MTTQDFIKNVKSKVSLSHFEDYQGGLEQIPVLFRRRYLFTLESCPDPCVAYDLLYKGRFLPEKNYKRFLRFMSPGVHY